MTALNFRTLFLWYSYTLSQFLCLVWDCWLASIIALLSKSRAYCDYKVGIKSRDPNTLPQTSNGCHRRPVCQVHLGELSYVVAPPIPLHKLPLPYWSTQNANPECLSMYVKLRERSRFPELPRETEINR